MSGGLRDPPDAVAAGGGLTTRLHPPWQGFTDVRCLSCLALSSALALLACVPLGRNWFSDSRHRHWISKVLVLTYLTVSAKRGRIGSIHAALSRHGRDLPHVIL